MNHKLTDEQIKQINKFNKDSDDLKELIVKNVSDRMLLQIIASQLIQINEMLHYDYIVKYNGNN